VRNRWNNTIRTLVKRSLERLRSADRFALTAVAAGVAVATLLLWGAVGNSRPVDSEEPTAPQTSVDPLADLHAAAGEADIWQSQAQQQRQWLLGQMSTLSRLLSEFPAIERAAVIIEPGRPGGLGRQGVAPKAAVNVRLADGHPMTAELLAAIADLVAGAVGGLDRQAVRVIDARGASFSLAEPLAVEALAQAQPVSPAADATPATVETLSVSAPSPGGFSWPLMLLVMIAVAEVAIVTALVVRRVRKRRRRLAWVRLRAIARRRQSRRQSHTDELRPFEILKQATLEDTVTLLSDQRDETVALSLAQLSPSRAARVLGRFGPARQVQIAACMASLDELDAAELQAIEQQLAERLAECENLSPRRQGGVSSVAKILHHSGQVGRRAVLEALAQQSPRLAESISRQLLGFEDIADLPIERLAAALVDVEPDELAIAVRTATDRVQQRLLDALDGPTAEAVRDRMQAIGPVRLSEVEMAQRQIIEAIRDYEAAAAGADLVGEGQVMA
jgi:hypothetical protein